MRLSIYVGFEPRAMDAFEVTRRSCERHLSSRAIRVNGLVLADLRARGLYHRPMEYRNVNGKLVMWDTISEAAQSTEHANARFFVPHLAKTGWALFCDGDMLYRDNVARLAETLDTSYAVYCVKHNHNPEVNIKMDGQVQAKYSRKNWSSFMFFNCEHPSNKKLTLDMLNSVPGRDLHRFCWLKDDEIGSIDPAWNWLVGYSDKNIEPKNVHFTDGFPSMLGYENVPYADEWWKELYRSAA